MKRQNGNVMVVIITGILVAVIGCLIVAYSQLILEYNFFVEETPKPPITTPQLSSIALSCEDEGRSQKYAQFLAKIAGQLGDVTCEKAESFIDYVDGFSQDIQNNFELIASDKTSNSRKKDLVKETVNNYFDNPTSTVQTSSINRPDFIRHHAVERYLKILAKLSQTKYVTVKLEYDKDYFNMGNIEYEYEDGRKIYSFKVNMWAMFEGCTESGRCYRDHTKKGFYMKLQTNRMRVDFVSVEDTVTEEDYRKLQRRWCE